MYYGCIMEADNKYYLMLNRSDKTVKGFENETDGIRYFEDSYRSNLARGNMGGAVLNWLTMKPSIVPLPAEEEIAKTVKLRIVGISNVSGGFLGLEYLDQEDAAKQWDAGTKPRLT